MPTAEKHDKGLDEFLAIRKPGARLDEDVVADDLVVQLGCVLDALWPSLQDLVKHLHHDSCPRTGARRLSRAPSPR